MIKPRRYFPLGKAYGEAFCNREAETAKLSDNIQRGIHTFLVAPRRYGKSSLAERALAITEIPWVKIDFHLAVTEEHAARLILKGVTELTGKAVSQLDQLSSLIKNTLKHLKPKLDISAGPFSLELEIEKSAPAENVAEALLLLDKLLQAREKIAVFLFDEFQEIGQIAQGKGIEGAIRHAAQDTQNLAIIFSGSNPHMIKNMFENERRPLYRLCKKLTLNRISIEHYRTHLDKAAQQTWHQGLPEKVFHAIITLSERHPYFMNALCDEVWAESPDTLPTVDTVHACWQAIIEGERSDLIKDFLRLSENQRTLLLYLAAHDGKELFSVHAFETMKIPPGSLHAALAALLEKDFIEKTEEGYRLVIPVYRQLLCDR